MCRGKVAEVKPHLERIWTARGCSAAEALAACRERVSARFRCLQLGLKERGGGWGTPSGLDSRLTCNRIQPQVSSSMRPRVSLQLLTDAACARAHVTTHVMVAPGLDVDFPEVRGGSDCHFEGARSNNCHVAPPGVSQPKPRKQQNLNAGGTRTHVRRVAGARPSRRFLNLGVRARAAN
jgi:hypothetical protein